MLFGFSMSGLQNFIFDVVDPNTKKDRYAARRLRIRSAMLNLVPATVATSIKEHDPNMEIIYLGGGKLIATASKNACDALEKELQELHKWLVERSSGKIGTCWTAVEGEIGSAPEIQKLLASLAKTKWRAGRAGDWFIGSGINKSDNSGGLGGLEWEKHQGAQLAKDENFIGFGKTNEKSENIWRIGKYSFELTTEKPDIGLAGKSVAQLQVAIPLHAPHTEEKPPKVVTLHNLAEEGEGASYLALLKLDGDKIGELLGNSLTDQSGDKYRAISAKLNDFFGVQIPKLLEQKFSRIYLVYSGGDDLVATGHFDTVLRAALKIKEEFSKIGFKNTVSAGVSFYTRDAPILKAAESADDFLKDAKQERNCINIAGCSISWEDFKLALNEIDEIVAAVQSGNINRGALQLLRQLGDPWLKDAPDEIKALRWRSIPYLNYARNRRNWNEEKWGGNLKQLFNELCTSENYLKDKLESVWQRASLIGTIAGWLTKIGETSDE